MEEGRDQTLLVDPLLGGEIEGVDIVQGMVGRLADHALDDRDGVGVRRLAQCGEQGVGFAHGAGG
jgi:hypothetical protein